MIFGLLMQKHLIQLAAFRNIQLNIIVQNFPVNGSIISICITKLNAQCNSRWNGKSIYIFIKHRFKDKIIEYLEQFFLRFLYRNRFPAVHNRFHFSGEKI